MLIKRLRAPISFFGVIRRALARLPFTRRALQPARRLMADATSAPANLIILVASLIASFDAQHCARAELDTIRLLDGDIKSGGCAAISPRGCRFRFWLPCAEDALQQSDGADGDKARRMLAEDGKRYITLPPPIMLYCACLPPRC